jgi:biotin operon repressor
MKYLTAVQIDGKLYKIEVEGEELTIPGFEQLKLFTYKAKVWYVCEAKTGRALGRALPTKEEAILQATTKLREHGLQSSLDRLKYYKSVTELPEYVELKNVTQII